ncbi:MAG TPA: restriction endonuclease subunit S [Thermoclostridium sp.]|nr:restriction endonuclease subunit S [Thermoclostridium sp.]
MIKNYQEKKPSGAPWLGNIPSQWECLKIGSLFLQRKTKVSDKEYPPLSVTKKGILPQLDTAAKSNDGDNRKLVKIGDFVINSRSDRKGSCGVSDREGSVSLINIVLEPNSALSHKYVHYLLRSQPFSEEYYRYGRGIVADLWTTRFSEMKNIFIPIPPPSEQEQIVHFLDWKVSGINRLIENKRKKLNSLKELKKDIVDCTVKSGIRDDVPVRDSGVYWIGKIPSHWSVMRLKSQIKLSNEKTSDNNLPYIGMENIESWTGKYVKKNEVKPESTSNVYKAGNILFGKLRPYLAKVFITEDDGICSSEFLVFKSFQLERKYLFYYLISSSFIDVVNSSTYGAKMPRANWDFIGNCPITIPPKEEQKEIVKYLDSVFIKIDSLIRNTEQIVERLRELKTRLISDVVTGQIDVRNIEIPEYEYVDEEPEGDSDDVNGDFDSEEISEEA